MKHDFLSGRKKRYQYVVLLISSLVISLFVLSMMQSPSEQNDVIHQDLSGPEFYDVTFSDRTVPPNECPDEPINPSPFDGETEVSTDTTLCVFVSDPDQDLLNVSFYWCDGTLIQTIEDVSSGTVVCTDPLNLDESTEYCWYVEVSDGECVVTGPMSKDKVVVLCWCFTTEEGNDCPEEPINPNPTDGEVLISINTILCVDVSDPDGDNLNVSFYWCDDTLIETITEVPSGSTICTSPLSLSYDTTYYWYAKVSDGICEESSECWEFTTEPRPCQDVVWIDDDFTSDTPGFDLTHFIRKQLALDTLDVDGIAYVYDGIYNEQIIIDQVPCDNTGITQMGEYGCFPGDESAMIMSNEHIFVDNVSILYMEYAPSVSGSIIVEPDISGTFLKCNKFNKDCNADAKGVIAHEESTVLAEYNWWGAPNGPNGGIMDDGALADGYGVMNQGDVLVEPWIGIHAEISQPVGTIEVEVGTPVHFDASESWAYGYGECCEPELLHMQYQWDFDDGFYNHNMITTHVFDSPGTYNVTLMTDAPGIPGLYPNTMFDWDRITVIVVDNKEQLSICIGEDGSDGYQVIRNTPIQFTSFVSGGNPPYIFNWDFGDNTNSNEQNPIHTYQQLGIYSVVLTVIDADWNFAQDTTTVTVIKPLPLDVSIQTSSILMKPEGSIHFVAEVDGGIAPYEYQWTIENKHYYGNVIDYSFDENGHYPVTLRVTDQEQSIMTKTIMMTIDDTSSIPLICEVYDGFGFGVKIQSFDEPVICSLQLSGSVMFCDPIHVEIPSGTVKTVDSGFFLGFGTGTVQLKANSLEETYKGLMIGPFMFNLHKI